MIFLIELLVLILSAVVVYEFYIHHSRNGKLVNKIHGPPTSIIFGNLPQFFFIKVEQISRITKENIKRYYPIYRFWVLFTPMVNILTPNDAEILLSSIKYIKKGRIYDVLKPWLKTGLLMSTGTKWQNRRKILTPAFHFNVLQKYMQVLTEHGAKVVKSLRDKKQRNEIELIPFLTEHTLSAICETAMGTPFDVIDPYQVKKYRDAVMFMGEVALYRFLHPWLMNNFIFSNFTAMGWKMKKDLRILHSFSARIIKGRYKFHEQIEGKHLDDFSFTNSEKTSKNGKNRMAMLDLLIAAQRDGLIDESGIKEEVDTFIFEGHDTSAMTLCYLIQLLAEHPDIQEKARSEINEIWHLNDDTIDMNTLNKLHYLERCIKESLRLFPSVPTIIRQLEEDMQLTNYLIPAGTSVNVYIFGLHRDPNYWPDPDKFDPDRFLPEKMATQHPFAFIPFSAGPRNCIGQKFAMMEIKIFTAFILKNFYLKSKMKYAELDRMPDLVYRTVQKVKIDFVPINNES